MKRFTQLVERLDQAETEARAAETARDYLSSASDQDLDCAIGYLLGRPPFRRLVTPKQLLLAAQRSASLSDWICQVCRDEIGDVSETAALIAPRADHPRACSLSELIRDRCLPLRGQAESERVAFFGSAWQEVDLRTRRIWHRMLLGTLRLKITPAAAARALSEHLGIPAPLILQRREEVLRKDRPPDWLRLLRAPPLPQESSGWPLPFPSPPPLWTDPLPGEPATSWVCSWKHRGPAVQLVRRAEQVFIWAADGELLNQSLPDLARAAQSLPMGTVLQGTWTKSPSPQSLPGSPKSSAGIFSVEELLEHDGKEQGDCPTGERHARLLGVLGGAQERYLASEGRAATSHSTGPWKQSEFSLEISPAEREDEHWPMLPAPFTEIGDWDDLPRLRAAARAQGFAGLELRTRLGSPNSGQTGLQGDRRWLPIEPQECRALLLSVEIRNGLPEYSFGVLHQGRWLAVADVPGLAPAEDREKVERFIQEHTYKRIGTIRLLEPLLVVQLSYEFKDVSPRRKAGLRLAGVRWQRTLPNVSPADCSTLDEL